MRRFALLLCLVVLGGPPALAQSAPRQLAAIPLLPLTAGDHPDVEELLNTHWRGYYRGSGEFGFTIDQVRAGRFDLDGDDDPELLLLIDKPNWQAQEGKPFVVATWVKGHWLAVGWGWGDEDQVFVTDEVIDGWRTLDTPKLLMRWTAKGYRRDPK